MKIQPQNYKCAPRKKKTEKNERIIKENFPELTKRAMKISNETYLLNILNVT